MDSTAPEDEAMKTLVKPLVWAPYPNEILSGPDIAIADTEFSHRYQVQRDPWAPTYVAYLYPRPVITDSTSWWKSGGHSDLDAAKAAAQADYARRILSTLDLTAAQAQARAEGVAMGMAQAAGIVDDTRWLRCEWYSAAIRAASPASPVQIAAGVLLAKWDADTASGLVYGPNEFAVLLRSLAAGAP